MAKSKEHTGFRNGSLFCFNCGSEEKMVFPLPLAKSVSIMKSFSKTHKNCPLTWKEPVPYPELVLTPEAIDKNAKWWMENGERGISSEAMYYFFLKKIPVGNSWPHDPGDFNRCYKLIEAVPQWKHSFYLLEREGETWKNIVNNWDLLSKMLIEWREEKQNKMYEFMKIIGC